MSELVDRRPVRTSRQAARSSKCTTTWASIVQCGTRAEMPSVMSELSQLRGKVMRQGEMEWGIMTFQVSAEEGQKEERT